MCVLGGAHALTYADVCYVRMPNLCGRMLRTYATYADVCSCVCRPLTTALKVHVLRVLRMLTYATNADVCSCV
jgi:hypothetical protein